jgi:hypothetical protein
MFYLSKTIFGYRFYKITEMKAESIGAPSVKEIVGHTCPEKRNLGKIHDRRLKYVTAICRLYMTMNMFED